MARWLLPPVSKPEFEESTDALKLIADWAKWVATIITGGLIFGISSFREVGNNGLTFPEWSVFGTLISGAAALIFAGCLLLGIPGAIQRTKNEDVYTACALYITFDPKKGQQPLIRIWWLNALLTLSALTAMIFYLAGAATFIPNKTAPPNQGTGIGGARARDPAAK